MTAYVHVNLRIKDPARQAALVPRFQAALQAAGGRILHFGPVAQMLEGDVAPLPMAGIFEFATLADALAFYHSPEYAPIKVERDAAQEARVDQSHRFDNRVLHERIEHLDIASAHIGDVAGHQDKAPHTGRRSQGPISLVLVHRRLPGCQVSPASQRQGRGPSFYDAPNPFASQTSSWR
jgi:uncharacterized protein (DUF1330 family)